MPHEWDHLVDLVTPGWNNLQAILNFRRPVVGLGSCTYESAALWATDCEPQIVPGSREWWRWSWLIVKGTDSKMYFFYSDSITLYKYSKNAINVEDLWSRENVMRKHDMKSGYAKLEGFLWKAKWCMIDASESRNARPRNNFCKFTKTSRNATRTVSIYVDSW